MTLKLGVMASGNGTNLQAILNAINSQQLDASVEVLVYNNPDAHCANRARQQGIPSILLNHRDYTSREQLDWDIIKVMELYKVDYIVFAGWMRIVSSTLVSAFYHRIVNIHPSLLPSFKGITAVEQALEAGVKITGCTVHFVELELDSGPIIAQAAVPVIEGDSVRSLHQRIKNQEYILYPKALKLLT